MVAAGLRWLFVFSHPNHEIAVFGLIQRLRPRLLYLTDGGPPERVAATEQGLDRVGLLDGAIFLNRRESALYQALVDRDLPFWQGLAAEVAAVIAEAKPDRVAADAVEYYNPVHDMCLPVVMAAAEMSGSPAQIYEVPLIRQRSADGGFSLQSPLGEDREAILLSDAEWATKWGTWTEVHGGQLYSLGELINAAGRPGLEREAMHRARSPLRRPQSAECLRYEVRGKLLAERGEVTQTITLDGHVHPVTRALLEA
jgi:LmbE family N-acetylglucosaminyl deacetylase